MRDAAGCFERDASDGLAAYEREILSRWDAGAAIAAIAAETGRSEKSVRHVVQLYDDRPDPDAARRLREANDRFVAALDAARMRPHAISVSEINDMLTDGIERLVRELLPNARKSANEMCVGSLAGEPGQSLRIHIGASSKRGWWKDYSSNEGGDALKLIADVLFAGDVRKAVQWAKSWLRLDDDDPARLEQHRIEVKARSVEREQAAEAERRKMIRSAKNRWLQALPIAPGDPVDRYLAGRAIDLHALGRAPGALRFHPSLQYGWQGPLVPAMVAQVLNLACEQVATHRTWIEPDGSGKAGPDLIGRDDAGQPNDPKKVMGSPLGGHIPLWKGTHRCPLRDIPPGTDVYVAEGIEDGLTAACADPSIRVICMIALGYLADLQLPEQMGRLIILKQNDPPGSKASKLLARGVQAHRAAGRRVAFIEPPAGYKDLNAMAQAQMESGK